MKRCMGKEITVVLKSSKSITGMLIEFNDEDAIIQTLNHKSIFIPRVNIEYYETVNVNLGAAIVPSQPVESLPKAQDPDYKEVLVSVDGNHVTKLFFPPNTNIMSCTPELWGTIIDDKVVKAYVSDKTIVNAHYDIGNLNIITRSMQAADEVRAVGPQTTFESAFSAVNNGYKNQIDLLKSKSVK